MDLSSEKLDDLIERVRTCEGFDKALNEEVAKALGWTERRVTRLGLNGRTPGRWHWVAPYDPFKVTASLPNLIGPRLHSKTLWALRYLQDGDKQMAYLQIKPLPKIVDDTPIHLKFGYAASVEKQAIRERLIAEGKDPQSLGFEFEAGREYTKAHINDLTYADRCRIRNEEAAQRAKEAWAAGTAERHTAFNKPELEYLAERFAFANDPLGQSILDKVMKVLRDNL